MKTSRFLYSFALSAAALGTAPACAPTAVTVEVLPPRTSVTCSAPSLADPASSRGLIDVRGSETLHGAFLADLRLSAKGADARVDGITVAYDIDGADLKDFDGDLVGGDAVLVGEDDDLRQVILENAQLLSRDAAIALRDDGDLDLSDVNFATVTVTLTPVLVEAEATAVEATSTTFALDVCDGCLVTPPTAEECPAGPSVNFVCRAGQDRPLFSCSGGA